MPHRIKIAVGADHAGFELKEKVREYLASRDYEVEDHGTSSTDSVDYPDFAERVATQVASKQATYGVLVCGTGLGMAVAANKVPGVRAAACSETLSARMAREHNDANVLTLGGRLIDEAAARKILDTWLATPFAGGRHERRLEKIATIDEKHQAEKNP